jgi:hypothetical protein
LNWQSWGRVFLQKLIGAYLIKKFPDFIEPQRFIALVKNAFHLVLSWAKQTQFTPSHLV